MEVRRATRDDLLDIGRIADAGHWETLAGLVKPDTIAQLLHHDFAPSALKRRLLSGGVLVATDAVGVAGFADAEVRASVVDLRVVLVESTRRRTGIGSRLLEAVRDLDPRIPVSIEVLLGDLITEQFLESGGFVPGETMQRDLHGEDIVSRRWWLAAM